MADAAERGSQPDRWQLGTTVVAGVVGVAVLVSAELAAWVAEAGFVLLEVIGRTLDRPTSLVVGGYAAAVLLAGVLELKAVRERRELLPTWLLVCGLSLLGQGYLFVLAAKLRPVWLLLALGLVVGGGFAVASRRSEPRSAVAPVAPIVALFVVLHVLVEGAAGHILTPWLHAVSDRLAGLSRTPVLYWPLVAVMTLGPVAGGLLAVKRGLRPIDWPHPDPRRLVDVLALPSLAALAVLGAHYGTTMWRCPPADAEGLVLLSDASGAFDLETSADGATLLASRREDRELLLLDLHGGGERRLSTARPTDTAFDRTEPETLLAGGDRFLVLLASSDSEQGNGLAALDRRTMTLGDRFEVRGISDVVGGAPGVAWLSTEFVGALVHFDHFGTGTLVRRIDLGDAETNKIVVEGATAWTAGLWQDPWLRKIDLQTGAETARAELGTFQWDLALSPEHRLLFVPKFVEGEVRAFDADTLEPRGVLPARFGVRPVEVSPDGEVVVTGNLYTGEVVGRGVADGTERFRRRIGGHVKALEIGPDGRIFAGSNCGVFEVKP